MKIIVKGEYKMTLLYWPDAKPGHRACVKLDKGSPRCWYVEQAVFDRGDCREELFHSIAAAIEDGMADGAFLDRLIDLAEGGYLDGACAKFKTHLRQFITDYCEVTA